MPQTRCQHTRRACDGHVVFTGLRLKRGAGGRMIILRKKSLRVWSGRSGMNTGANMANIRARYRLGNLSLTLALVLAASLPAAAQQKSKFTGTPVPQGATYAVGVTTGSGTAGARIQAQAQTRAVKRVSVIVKLADPSLAAYKGGINGLSA